MFKVAHARIALRSMNFLRSISPNSPTKVKKRKGKDLNQFVVDSHSPGVEVEGMEWRYSVIGPFINVSLSAYVRLARRDVSRAALLLDSLTFVEINLADVY